MNKRYKILLAICGIVLLIPTGCWLEHERAKGMSVESRNRMAKMIGGPDLKRLYAAANPGPLAQADFLRGAELLKEQPLPAGFYWTPSMSLLHSGRARVPWRVPADSTTWDEIESVLGANQTSIEMIMKAIALEGHWQPAPDASPSFMENDFSPAGRIRRWLINVTLISLKRDDRATALTQLVATLQVFRVLDLGMRLERVESPMPIVWTALHSASWSAVELETINPGTTGGY